MTMKCFLVGGALAASLTANANAAQLLNGGFEDGLNHWTYTPGVYLNSEDGSLTGPLVETSGAVQDALAVEYTDEGSGSLFAHLTAGANPADLDQYTLLSSEAFDVALGAVVSFRAAFLGFDYDPYFDDGYVKLIRVDAPLASEVILFSSSTLATGQGSTGWIDISSLALAAGSYRIEAGVRDQAPDGSYYPGFHSQLLLDQVAVTGGGAVPAPIPEPATWALMIMGFGGAGAMIRRRRLQLS